MKNNNPFKDIEESQMIPPELKSRVMTSVKKVQLLLDIFDFFTVKIGRTLKDMFLTRDKK